MYKKTKEVKGNKKISVANVVTQRKPFTKRNNELIDNRVETVLQRNLIEKESDEQKVSQFLAVEDTKIQTNPLIQLNGLKRTFSEAFGDDYESDFEPPKKRRRLSGIHRLYRAYLRNRNKKATPVNSRNAFERQQLHNYGYEHKNIEYGAVKGNFYKGPFGGQPYLGIKKEDYGLRDKPLTNYDAIISSLSKFGDDSALATIIIDKIIHGTELPQDMDANVKANVSLIIQLTQFIEPHESRVPGIDKFARSFFRKIASRSMTFSQVFNRKNGLFVVARATGGGAVYGGQESGRTLVGMPAKKSDKSKASEIWSPEIDHVAEDMSDSSDEE